MARFTSIGKYFKYIFKKNHHLTETQKKQKYKGIAVITGFVLILLQLTISVIFIGKVLNLNMFPLSYISGIIVILALITVYNFLSQFTSSHILGKCLAVILSGLMIFGYLVTDKINTTLDHITTNITRTSNVDIIVLKDDDAIEQKDVLSYVFGYNKMNDNLLVPQAIQSINTQSNVTLNTKTYDTWDSLVNALYENKEIKAIAVSSNLRVTLAEENTEFTDKTRILNTISVTSEAEIVKGEVKAKGEPFVMYISGNDEYGKISDTGRSDVNIIAVINPETRQVLLVSTPRDYYITVTGVDYTGKEFSGFDKLTHAGVAGIKYSMKALSDLYGIDFDYFFKVNFDGCVNIVDALGGITIYSDVEFTNGTDAAPEQYHFVEGANECDGAKTLAFVRERSVFGIGDVQRGRNQQAAISAMIDKATSPAILTNYASILDAVSNVMYTNMPVESIQQLVKEQLDDNTAWNVQSFGLSYQVSADKVCEVYGGIASCLEPDYEQVNIAIKLINKILNDEIFDLDEYVSLVSHS